MDNFNCHFFLKNININNSKVHEEEVTKQSLGGQQGICNDGLYEVLMQSRKVDAEEKISTVNNFNGKEMTFLTEDGFYEVLMQSRKPIAKAFKKEVKKIIQISEMSYNICIS